jgi:uncharacterized protein
MKLKGDYFDENYVKFDVDDGVIKNRAGTRLLALSEDFLRGFRKAVMDETGDAHHVVFETCGKTWGENLARRFQKETALYYECEFEALPMSMFSLLFKNFWARHGWGELEINWEQGYHEGVFEVVIHNPAFSSIFGAEGLNDDIFVGVLSAFFSRFAGRELQCIQTEESVSGDIRLSRFILSLPERLARVPDMVLSQKSHQDIVQVVKL